LQEVFRRVIAANLGSGWVLLAFQGISLLLPAGKNVVDGSGAGWQMRLLLLM